MSYLEFLDTIRSYPKIDTHEHIPAERFAVGNPIDFFDFLVPYICDNLLTAGATTEQWVLIQSKHRPFEERWGVFEMYIEDIRHTTYFKALWRTLHDCYSMTEMSLEEAERVSRILQDENKHGLYRKIFDQNNIESTLSFVPWNSLESGQDENLYPVPTVSDISIRSRDDISMIEKATGVTISNFDALLLAIHKLFDHYAKSNVMGIKFGSAYRRKLDFDVVSRQEAEDVFLKVIAEKVNGDSKMCGMPSGRLMLSEVKSLDDFLTDFMTGIAAEKGMPVFFHVGIHAWNENSVESIHASYLETLIRRHPEATFILLHCGMPFIDDAIILCKYFRNVSLNMTWCHIIDREQSRLCVRKFIELLPISKITGFGGDYIYPQQVYGHLQFAIENIATALWELVEQNEMSEKDALSIARKWFYENPKKLLKL